MKHDLIDLLRNGNHSLIIHRDTTSVYDTRGIATLLQIIDKDSNELSGATVVDKVVGKAAAALMIVGGVSELHAMLISQGALSLLVTTDVCVSYDTVTDHIINRNHSGWCPMELACRDCITAEECITEIRNLISKQKCQTYQ